MADGLTDVVAWVDARDDQVRFVLSVDLGQAEEDAVRRRSWCHGPDVRLRVRHVQLVRRQRHPAALRALIRTRRDHSDVLSGRLEGTAQLDDQRGVRTVWATLPVIVGEQDVERARLGTVIALRHGRHRRGGLWGSGAGRNTGANAAEQHRGRRRDERACGKQT